MSFFSSLVFMIGKKKALESNTHLVPNGTFNNLRLFTCGLSRSSTATSVEAGRDRALPEEEGNEFPPPINTIIDDGADDDRRSSSSSATARAPVAPHHAAAHEGGWAPSRATSRRRWGSSSGSSGGDAISLSTRVQREKEREKREKK